MAETDTNLRERQLNADTGDQKKTVVKTKSKDNPKELYLGILLLSVVFILGFACAKYFGNSKSSNGDVDEFIRLLKDKNVKGLLQESDIENLKNFVQDLTTNSANKDRSQMSHKELMEELSKTGDPNVIRNIFLEKIFIFFIFVISFLFWVFFSR